MKKIYLLTLILMYLLLFSCNERDDLVLSEEFNCKEILNNWDVNSISYQDGIQKQNDIFFPTDNVGFSVGNAGSILRTLDSGENWDVVEHFYLPETGINTNSVTKARLLTVHFIDETIGYAGGEGELSRNNNGTTRTGAVLLNTIDGGENWNKQYLENYGQVKGLFFTDRYEGIGLLSGKTAGTYHKLELFNTKNGGESWDLIDLSIKKITSSSFIMSPTKIMVTGVDNANNPILLIRNKDEEIWRIKNLPQEECNRIYFIDDDNGFASCGLLFFPENIYQTKDGGNSWKQIESPFNISSLIHFNTIDEGFVINPVIEYIDGGGGWELTPELQFYEIFQTYDGGKNWEKSEINKACNLMGVSYSPSKNVFYNIGVTANRFKLN